MKRLDEDMFHKWHVALNNFNEVGGAFFKWMYAAKQMADEVPRMIQLFELERTGKLPVIHQQCSYQEPVPIKKNRLSCCFGIVCGECEYLEALDDSSLRLEKIDVAKAWTCAGHIMANHEDIDTSEGYILTTDDKMFWENVYKSLAGADDLEMEE